jgi:hypothetical protein
MYLFILLILILILILFYFFTIPVKLKVVYGEKDVKIEDFLVEYSDLTHYVNTRPQISRSFFQRPIEIVQENGVYEIPEDLADNLRVDVQNVHSNSVQKNVKKAYEKTNKISVDNTDIIDKVRPYTDDKKVIKILEKIINRNSYISNLNSYEKEIINNVWDSGDENVKKEIIKQISDCMVDDNLVCPTGVSTRITSSIYINDPEKYPKSVENLKQEILNKFSNEYKDTNDKTLAKTKTVDSYHGVYEKEYIESLINEWIEYV